MPTPHVFMMNPDNPEENVEDPIIEEGPEFETPPEIPTFDSFSHSNIHTQGFSFDTIPPSKWLDKLYEIHAWCTAAMLSPNATLSIVITKCTAKFLGRLRQWYMALGEYRQLQLKQLPTLDQFISVLHTEFLGDHDNTKEFVREEYLSMRCCSFKRKDLEKHYDRMSQRFYLLNGMDDVNLKQAFLNSLPEPLGNETTRLLQTKGLTLNSTSLGGIYQHSLIALEKLCNHQKFLRTLEEQGKLLGKACDRPDLSIKCKDKKCTCRPSYRKSKYFQK
jgi:hypothetical protein